MMEEKLKELEVQKVEDSIWARSEQDTLWKMNESLKRDAKLAQKQAEKLTEDEKERQRLAKEEAKLARKQQK